MNKLDVTLNLDNLTTAIKSHTSAISKGLKVGTLVRDTFMTLGITANELLPSDNEFFSGREEVRAAVLAVIAASFPANVTKIVSKPSKSQDDRLAYKWADHGKAKGLSFIKLGKVSSIVKGEVKQTDELASDLVLGDNERTPELKKAGFKTAREHRAEWIKQPNSRLNDYRSSLANITGAIITAPKGKKAKKVSEDVIKQQATNLLNAVQDSDELELSNAQFNALIKTLNILIN